VLTHWLRHFSSALDHTGSAESNLDIMVKSRGCLKSKKDIKEDTYNLVTAKIRTDKSLYETNGYLIMVVLVVGLSLLSQLISQRQQKKSGQITDANSNGMMKVMLWMMPIMLLVFALTSSSAFTLYMVANSIMTLIVNFLTTFIVNLTDGTYNKKEVEVIRHGRIDPNDKINK